MIINLLSRFLFTLYPSIQEKAKTAFVLDAQPSVPYYRGQRISPNQAMRYKMLDMP